MLPRDPAGAAAADAVDRDHILDTANQSENDEIYYFKRFNSYSYKEIIKWWLDLTVFEQ